MIHGSPVSVPALLVAALSGFVIGGLWYGPLFIKPWMAALTLATMELLKGGFDPELGIDRHFYAKAVKAAKTARAGGAIARDVWVGRAIRRPRPCRRP